MTTSDSKLADVTSPEHSNATTDASQANDSPAVSSTISETSASQTVNQDNTSTASTPNTGKSSQRNTAPQPSRQAGSGLTWLLLLINVIFIGAAGYGGYYGWTQWQLFQTSQQEQIQKAQNETQQQITRQLTQEITQQLTAQQQRMEQQASSLTQNTEQQVAAQNGRLQDMMQQIQRLSGTQATSWQTAEAMFLIRMAGRKIWLENNPQTAILLLQQADHQLANISDSRLYLVRQKIAQDINQLHAKKQALPDQQVLRLQSLYQSVETMPFAQSALIASRQNRSSESDGSFWGKTSQWFKTNVIEINRVEQAVQPLLTEEHTWLVREQIRFQLLVAQQALLQEQTDMFRNSLTQLTTLVNQYLDPASPNVSGFQAQLNLVSQHKFTSASPAKLSSETALAAFLQQESQPLGASEALSPTLTQTSPQGDNQQRDNQQEQAL